ncbi:hypothetical protein CK203_039788 [Vitis vinifera]|uniref:Uncharacterized protein n=1 Tax=Vitis vinifera TaxID=29760 RepID=A0A438HQD1_VITVI|nr:hypothetical protein CK203_039788 [Vitis vinifera]
MEDPHRPVTGYPAPGYPQPHSTATAYPYNAPPPPLLQPQCSPPLPRAPLLFPTRHLPPSFPGRHDRLLHYRGHHHLHRLARPPPSPPVLQRRPPPPSPPSTSPPPSSLANGTSALTSETLTRRLASHTTASKSSIAYKSATLSQTTIAPFYQGTKNETTVRATFAAIGAYVDVLAINAERTRGSVSFTVKVFARVSFKSGVWKARSRFLSAQCNDIALGLPSNASRDLWWEVQGNAGLVLIDAKIVDCPDMGCVDVVKPGTSFPYPSPSRVYCP